MVDRSVLASRLAAIQDAVARIREVLPPTAAVFAQDRTLREVVVLNLFVAIQEALDLASHLLADQGKLVPSSYRTMFDLLAQEGILAEDLARELASAAGLRNLIAHRYGALDWALVHEIAATRLHVLEAFCAVIAQDVSST